MNARGRSGTNVLTFEPGGGNWGTVQPVIVSAINNDDADGDATLMITHRAESADSNYNIPAADSPTQTITVIDDDD